MKQRESLSNNLRYLLQEPPTDSADEIRWLISWRIASGWAVVSFCAILTLCEQLVSLFEISTRRIVSLY